MTDRELLELAAKAAGFSLVFGGPDGDIPRISECLTSWNPLNADGDALRLAVKFGFVVDTDNQRVIEAERLAFGHKDWVYADDEDLTVDEATRRAIVRAAAAIGSKL